MTLNFGCLRTQRRRKCEQRDGELNTKHGLYVRDHGGGQQRIPTEFEKFAVLVNVGMAKSVGPDCPQLAQFAVV